MVEPETRRLPVVGPELRKSLQRIADELRVIGAGRQAEQVDTVAELLVQPKLRGVVAQLSHPSHWPTREHALWMAERLTVAGSLIEALLEDAEITGSTETIDAARSWLESLGFNE